MEFGTNTVTKLRRNIAADENGIIEKEYVPIVPVKIEKEVGDEDFNLSMYKHPYADTITLGEFEKLGRQRLAVLRELESLKEKHAGDHKKYVEAFKEVEKIGSLSDFGSFFTNGLLASRNKDARREDRISHFILRLAVCLSPKMSEWFVRQETELFRMRFTQEYSKEILKFLKMNNFNLEEITESEKMSLLPELSHSLTIPFESLLKLSIYKVNCFDVLDLFASYRAYLKNGLAYITSEDLVALAAPQFRENIASSIAHARKEIGVPDEEDELFFVLNDIVGNEKAFEKAKHNNSDQIDPDMIDDLAKESFPPCMRTIHSSLRREHHLKHSARQQYGLFLKGAGLSMESSLDFFRSEFTKKMDSERFSKEYSYNIRHMFGKEGNRVEKKPLSCATIILGSTPTPMDCHGCPFKHSDPSTLSKKLESLGLQNDQIAEIQDLSKRNRFDKACTKYFEIVHKIPELEELITHPNQYFTLSRKIHRGELPLAPSTSSANFEMETDNE